MPILVPLLFFILGVTPALAAGPEKGTRMLRYPDLHGNQVVFSYAGDLWLASIRDTSAARRLTSHPGLELYPRFSPDGTRIAFTGQYHGDEQVYVIDVEGGAPAQLTFYPTKGPLPARWGTDHQVFGWSPDGAYVLFRSMRQDFNDPRLFRVPVTGGLPQALPMVRAGSGDFSPDGRQIVYAPLFRDFRTWKRYEGGWAQDLYIYDLTSNSARQLTRHVRTERDPMWLEAGVYFVSDRTGTMNLYRASEDGRHVRLTSQDTWDIRWASSDGKSRIVYEVQGRIGLYDTSAETERLLTIRVPDDGVRRMARRIEVADQMEGYAVSPGGERVAVVARGDIFSVPAEQGVTRNLTRRGDAHDREVAWSPDGQHIAFVSDRDGEEQLYVTDDKGKNARKLTSFEPLRLYAPRWSPDSEAVAIHDHRGRVHLVDLTGGHRVAFSNPYGVIDDYQWAPDSRWITFSALAEHGMNAVYVWSGEDGQARRVSPMPFNAYAPAFSPDGQHLYFLSDRQFAPQIGSFEWNYVADRETGIFAMALTDTAGNPFGPRNDEVTAAPSRDDGADSADGESEESAGKGQTEKDEDVRLEIDFDDIAERVIRVPVEATNMVAVMPLKDRLLYATAGPFYYGREADVKPTLHAFEVESRETTQIIDDIRQAVVSADGNYVVVQKQGKLHRIELSNPGTPKAISGDNMIVHRAPATEWGVVFDEVWRRFRDHFYVPNMHGYDWEALRARYRPLVQDVSTREDLNALMGEMIAELNVGHAYVSGGDLQAGDRPAAALLGARLEADTSASRYRIAHIYAGDNAEPKYRSPLTEVGVDVNVGDYVLAIDGRELTTADNPYQWLTGRGQQPVELRVSDRPEGGDLREVLVAPIPGESDLAYLEWVQGNLEYVTERTNGAVGYLHIPDMGAAGIYEFVKWFYPQLRKQGLIVDVRGNGGGNVSQMILRRLMQKPLAFGFRANSEWADTYPQTAFNGPMVALINENSASDGDIFPYFFREAGLGPLIGKRTWGGVVGITDHGPLIDGGSVNVPEFADMQPGKGWIIEGEGVMPDIEVDNDPSGRTDAQLDRGIAEVLRRIEASEPAFPERPAAPVKLDGSSGR